MTELPAPEWLSRLAAGDAIAAAEFWQRYRQPMERLADRHLGGNVRRRVDAEDVVQSACRTFFRRMGEGQFEVSDEGDLWRLICAITLNKARDQVRFHSRQKRDVGRQEPVEEWTTTARREEEDPAWLVAWSDSLENWLSGLTDEQQSVLQMRLEGRTQQEIADRLGCAERTVRRILTKIQERAQADSHFAPA